jgi:hypothetical protein
MEARARPKNMGVPVRIVMWRPLTPIFSPLLWSRIGLSRTQLWSRIGLSRTQFIVIIEEMLHYNCACCFIMACNLVAHTEGDT